MRAPSFRMDKAGRADTPFAALHYNAAPIRSGRRVKAACDRPLRPGAGGIGIVYDI
jgi:hypothetical protein